MKLRKLFAALTASAIAITASAVIASAEESVAFSGKLAVQSTGGWWDQADVAQADFIGETDPATVTKVVVTVDKAGSIGYNCSTTGDYLKVDLADGGSAELTDVVFGEDYFMSLCVSSGDASYVSNFTWDVYADASLAAAEEEAATEEEAVEEEVVEEEATEEEVVEEEAAEGFALEECYNNGTVILVADDGQNAYATSNGIDITSVYGYRVTTQFPVAEATDEAAWIGGGIGANSNSTGWASTEWGKASGEKPIVAEFDENGVCVIELLGDAPVFAADDAYAQLWIQCWGGTMNIISVDVLGEGGSVIASATVGELAAAEAPEAEEEVEEAPATGDVDASTDSSKGSPDTGVADVAAVAGIAVVAAGAFIVAKKRK